MQNMTKYRQPMEQGFFEDQLTADALSEMGNPRLAALVDFEMFRPTLEEAMVKKVRKSPAGRRPIDPVLLFKILVLQRFFGLSDRQTQYQITDRASFRQFLGIRAAAGVPDEKTVWAFRERLAETGALDRLFADFRAFLDGPASRSARARLSEPRSWMRRGRGTPGRRTPP